MKAKQWADRFRQDPIEAAKEFVAETKSLISARGGSSAAIEASMREQEQKWAAVRRLAPDVDPEGYAFYGMFTELAPDTWKTYCQVAHKARKHREYQLEVQEANALRQKADQETDPTARLGLLFASLLVRKAAYDEFKSDSL